MKKYLYYYLLSLLAINLACTSNQETQQAKVTSDQDPAGFYERTFENAAAQYKVMMTKLPDNAFPITYHATEDKILTAQSGAWISGFYPGTLIYLYEETGDQELFDEARRIMKMLEKEQYNKNTHDLGFMMYCSFGNAKRIEPNPEYDEIIINSARSLSSRFNEKVGSIRSWNSNDSSFLVIIDNMMNLELLFNATKLTGDSSFYDIAVKHANTTIKNHFRPDNSSYHVVDYDQQTGKPKIKKTAQGAADESSWARGQSWGLYGFTMTYRETGDKKYLDQANKIADFILNHPNLPKDKIPYWDYDAPGIPDAVRDASAGAIMASALIELAEYNEEEKAAEYLKTAEDILISLSSPEYKSEVGDNGGFILKHSVGSFPANVEVDVPLTYADYYFIEALKRFRSYRETNGGQDNI